MKSVLNSPGDGCVLVVDGGGSLNTALMGDLIAAAAVENGWAGVVINGAVRDRAVLAGLPLGIKALGSNPRKSAKESAGEVDAPVEILRRAVPSRRDALRGPRRHPRGALSRRKHRTSVTDWEA